MRHFDVSGLGGRPVDPNVLRRLDDAGITARGLANTLAVPVSSLAPKLQALAKAGLAQRHWPTNSQPARTYTITDAGHDYLTRLDRWHQAAGTGTDGTA